MKRAALLLALVAAAHPTPARAATQCFGSVGEFNGYMDTQIASAVDVTLSFTITGVNLADYFNGKGWVAELGDTRCSAGTGIASLKVYGTADPPNPSHPPGTMKLEYGSWCCAAATCPQEYWAVPMPGDQVFSDPSQVCSVVEHVSATTVSYDIQCDGGVVHHAENPNYDAMQINRAAVLSEITGGHAMTNATASNVQICFELGGPPAGSQTAAVIEDVTVAPQYPNTVYPDANDLACGANDGTIYLKFDLRGVNGRATSAKLYLHSGADASSTGTGGGLYAVADTSWSETTLTWNARPTLGAALGRVSGVSPDLWYSVDVTSAISAPAFYAFALAPDPTDTNTAHFLSKEASTTLRPYLLLQVVSVDGDGDGYNDGPDCNDANAAVHPGAAEACDGLDNDCSGAVDEGCPGVPDAAWPVDGSVHPGIDGPPGPGVNNGFTSCGCRAAGRRPVGLAAGVLLALLALVVARRRTGG